MQPFDIRGAARWLAVSALAALAAVSLPEGAEGQYFGSNQVRYHDLDFEVLETERFDLYYYERESAMAPMAARMAERWYGRLATLMDHELRGRQPFILYANHPHFMQTTAVAGRIGQGTGGVTEPLNRRVVLPMAGPLADTDHVIGHELVHAFQYDMGGVTPGSPRFGAPTISRTPLWVIEGMAEYLARGPESAMTAMWMRDALVQEDSLPSIRELRNSREYFPYRWGHSLLSYIGGTWGEDAVMDVFRGSMGRTEPSVAVREVVGMPADSLAAEWHRALRDTYGPIREQTAAPSEFGEAVFGEDDETRLNVGPALSPDGSRLLFLSQRDPLSIDLYLADPETGEVIRRVTRSSLDPHYHSLQFINSAGAWAPSGDRFAFAAIQSGQPIITIARAGDGERVRTLRFPELGAAFNPTWSPDGGEIAFVANDGGVLDLFVVSVETGDVRRLTDDAFAELHPDWSPDGSRIAIATDRYTTDLEVLDTGPFRLATVDVESGDVRPLASFEDAKNITPRWGSDGRTLYFVANPGGIPNVYRLEPGGAPEALTNLYVGVSGITDLSPALASAQQGDRVVFTAYREGRYTLYRVDEASQVAPAAEAGAPVSGQTLLPPDTRRDGRLVELLRRPDLGLPDPATFTRRDYSAGLSLDYIAQPSLGFGISSFGSFIGGGASFLFSDMLGYHSLTAQLQLSIRDGNVAEGIGAIGQYVNRSNRVSWGVIAGQMPQIGQSIRGGTGDVDNDGQQELVRQTLRFWQINRQAKGLAVYPFSPHLRLEATAGYERTDFTIETDEQVISFEGPNAGQLESEQTISAPPCGDSLSFRTSICEPGTLNQAVASIALVHDNSILGPTGPLAGQRYRIEASPSYGTLNYTSALLDYRRYFQVAEPVTLAGRALHYGRYGADARDDRLSRLYLGQPSLLRGYERGSFRAANCATGTPLEDCTEVQVLGQLFGSKMALVNAEARLSVFGPLGILGARFLPVDLVAFYDAGVAWTRDSQASFLGGPRDPLASAGVGIRFNLAGFFLGEIDWVNPLDRPGQGAYVTFNINSGF